MTNPWMSMPAELITMPNFHEEQLKLLCQRPSNDFSAKQGGHSNRRDNALPINWHTHLQNRDRHHRGEGDNFLDSSQPEPEPENTKELALNQQVPGSSPGRRTLKLLDQR